MQRAKIILSQLNAIGNTELGCCENSKTIYILAHLWLGFGLPWERSTGGGSAEFPPPSLLLVSCWDLNKPKNYLRAFKCKFWWVCKAPSCKPQPYHLPPRLGPVWDGKLAPGLPISCRLGGTPETGDRDGWWGKKLAMDTVWVPRSVVAALTIFSKYSETYIWGFAYLTVCLCVSVCNFVCMILAVSNTTPVFSVTDSEPASLTD